MYWILVSLSDETVQHMSFVCVTGTHDNNIHSALLCCLCISAILCVCLPFSSFVSCSNTLLQQFLEVYSTGSLFFYFVYIQGRQPVQNCNFVPRCPNHATFGPLLHTVYLTATNQPISLFFFPSCHLSLE